jgi:capsid protein
MRPGHEVKFASPTQPASTFGDFTIAIAKFVGSATGIPYEVLLKQYNSSYSASRGALLDFWKRVRKYRALVVDQLCQPVYEEWLTDAISLGRITKFKGNWDDPIVRRAMLRCVWTGTSAGSLDPSKEVAAADQKVRCGFSTIEREASELNGSNWHDNVRQSSVEMNEFQEAGLIYPPDRPLSGRGSGVTALPPPGQQQATPAPTPAPGKEPAAPQVPQSPVAKAKSKRRTKKQPVELASGLSGRFER